MNANYYTKLLPEMLKVWSSFRKCSPDTRPTQYENLKREFEVMAEKADAHDANANSYTMPLGNIVQMVANKLPMREDTVNVVDPTARVSGEAFVWLEHGGPRPPSLYRVSLTCMWSDRLLIAWMDDEGIKRERTKVNVYNAARDLTKEHCDFIMALLLDGRWFHDINEAHECYPREQAADEALAAERAAGWDASP